MKNKIKKFLLSVSFISLQFGFDIVKPVKFFRGIPRYIRDYWQFRSSYNGPLEILPCLHDWYEEGGNTKGEYFLQDLYVARMISQAKPKRHIDIGSSIEGFVAHVASFREIEVLDVRPITSEIPGIVFKQANLALPVSGVDKNSYDSVSCLHALEHFGLGRYGDPIDTQGHKKGLRNMTELLSNEGTFYLSTPIGKARVEFNANRVFDPREILAIATESGLTLRNFLLIQDSKVKELLLTEEALHQLANQRYALGIFIFIKVLV